MSEFGHIAMRGKSWRADAWGTGPFIIVDEKGNSHRFEDSDRFGPFIITRRGEIKATQPGERNPFWRAHRIWVRQGRTLAEDGMSCIWNEPMPSRVYMIGKRTAMVIEDGDEDGRCIVEPKPGVDD